MKVKGLGVLLAFLLLFHAIAFAETNQEIEIVFRGIPWGTSYEEVDEQNQKWGMYALDGDLYDVKGVKDVLKGGYSFTDYEFKD